MLNQTAVLSQKQGIHLTLTTQLQQAIALLSLSSYDLQQFVSQHVESNPLLEGGDKSAPKSVKSHTDLPPIVAYQESFYDVISRQITMAFHDPDERRYAMLLWYHLDENGLLDASWKTVLTPENEFLVHHVLAVLKTFEPRGVFSESVCEALIYQMTDFMDAAEATLMMEAFQALIHKPFEIVCRHFNLDPLEFQKFLQQLKTLNFRPAQGFNDTVMTARIPDVRVFLNEEGELALQLNPDVIPDVLLNTAYYQALSQRMTHKDDLTYLKEHYTSGHWPIQALKKRHDTLLRVSFEMAKWQESFLLREGQMEPMTLKDIAQKSGVHESTVSRITQEKYLQTPRGILELKSLFVNTVSGSVSCVTVQNALKNIIRDEPKSAPFSDIDLVNLLKIKGFNVARRTISKYRTLLNIGTAAERKRYYQLAL